MKMFKEELLHFYCTRMYFSISIQPKTKFIGKLHIKNIADKYVYPDPGEQQKV